MERDKILGVKYPWALGHLALETACFVKEIQLARRDPEHVVIFADRRGFANSYFAKSYIGSFASLHQTDASLEALYSLARAQNRLVDCTQYASNDKGVAKAFEIFSASRLHPPPFTLLEADLVFAKELIGSHFGHSSFPHVTVSVRQNFGRPQDSSHTFRNSNFDSVLPALKHCFERFNREIFVILVGDNFYPETLPHWIWNYPSSELKSERGDVALLGSACFHFGTNSGINNLPSSFGRPCVLHNVFPYGCGSLGYNDLIIYKSVFDSQLKRNLTLREARQLSFVSPFDMLNYQSSRYLIQENSSNEIVELMDHAIDLMRGKINPESFESSDRLYESLLPQFRYNKGMSAHILTPWLERNLSTFGAPTSSPKRYLASSIAGAPTLDLKQELPRGNNHLLTPFHHYETKPTTMTSLHPSYAPDFVNGSSKISIVAEKPVAYESPDHFVPWGTARDNSQHPGFNEKLMFWIPKLFLSVLDIGCSGGGFVRSLVDEGIFSVGVEGSDYSKVRARAEWATIPDRLFTADATAPFNLFLSKTEDTNLEPVKFSIITAWEMIEHVKESDLVAVFSNIDSHLIRNGVVVMSISPNDDFINGVNLHQCVHDKPWWIQKLGELGWQNHDAIVDYFGVDWVRSEPNAPGSFHVCLTRKGEDPLFFDRVDRNAFIYNKHGQPTKAISRLLAESFSFRTDPVFVCDAGVRGGFEGLWEGYQDFLHLVGIDLDPIATSSVNSSQTTQRQSVISRPVGAGAGNALLHRTRNEVASSFLQTNWDFVRRFPQMIPGEIVGHESLEYVGLKEELERLAIPRLDYLKLDLEGYELEALKGLQGLQSTLLCISVEIFFQPYRYGAPTYGMVESYLSPLGFSLFDLHLERWNRNCVADPNNRHTWYGQSGQVIWGQAIFLKDPILFGLNLDSAQLARLAFLADLLGFKDFALELVSRYQLLKFA